MTEIYNIAIYISREFGIFIGDLISTQRVYNRLKKDQDEDISDAKHAFRYLLKEYVDYDLIKDYLGYSKQVLNLSHNYVKVAKRLSNKRAVKIANICFPNDPIEHTIYYDKISNRAFLIKPENIETSKIPMIISLFSKNKKSV